MCEGGNPLAIRKSVRALSVAERTEFIDALRALKRERTAPGAVSTYDQYVVMHARAMSNLTPYPADSDSVLLDIQSNHGRVLQDQDQAIPPQFRQFLTRRNSAHRGPAFLPWHRQFLQLFEEDLQRVSGNPALAIPYWDWEVDGELPAEEQRDTSTRAVWLLLGGDGDPNLLNMVTDGPFAFDPGLLNDPDIFTDDDAWLTVDALGRQVGFLQRAMGQELVDERDPNTGDPVLDPETGEVRRVPVTLPTLAEFDAAIAIEIYDSPNWDERSSPDKSFRNVMEGWIRGPGLHNRVHVWVGGSMGPGTSPNDPVFFLHHCNVDRQWALWQKKHPNSPYLPKTGGPLGHNVNDLMYPWNGVDSPLAARPADLLSLGSVEYAEPPHDSDDSGESNPNPDPSDDL